MTNEPAAAREQLAAIRAFFTRPKTKYTVADLKEIFGGNIPDRYMDRNRATVGDFMLSEIAASTLSAATRDVVPSLDTSPEPMSLPRWLWRELGLKAAAKNSTVGDLVAAEFVLIAIGAGTSVSAALPALGGFRGEASDYSPAKIAEMLCERERIFSAAEFCGILSWSKERLAAAVDDHSAEPIDRAATPWTFTWHELAFHAVAMNQVSPEVISLAIELGAPIPLEARYVPMTFAIRPIDLRALEIEAARLNANSQVAGLKPLNAGDALRLILAQLSYETEELEEPFLSARSFPYAPPEIDTPVRSELCATGAWGDFGLPATARS